MRRLLLSLVVSTLFLLATREARAGEDAARTPKDAPAKVDARPKGNEGRFALDVEPGWIALLGDAPRIVPSRYDGTPRTTGGILQGGVLGGGAFARFRYARVGAQAALGLLDGTGGEPDQRHVVYLYAAVAAELVGPGFLDRVHLGVSAGSEWFSMGARDPYFRSGGRRLLSGYVAGAYGRLDLVRVGAISVYARASADVRVEGATSAYAPERGVLWGPRLGGGISWVL